MFAASFGKLYKQTERGEMVGQFVEQKLPLRCSFMCNQIYNNHCYVFGHTLSYLCPTYGSFTLVTFVSQTAGISDRGCHLTVLALATLGGATQIGSFLFMSCHPRWPRQVSNDCRVPLSHVTVACHMSLSHVTVTCHCHMSLSHVTVTCH